MNDGIKVEDYNSIKWTPNMLQMSKRHIGLWTVAVANNLNKVVLEFFLEILTGCKQKNGAILAEEPYSWPRDDYVWAELP